MQCSAKYCSVVQCSAVQCSAVQCSEVDGILLLGEPVGANKGKTGESKEEDFTEFYKTSSRKVGESDNAQT